MLDSDAPKGGEPSVVRHQADLSPLPPRQHWVSAGMGTEGEGAGHGASEMPKFLRDRSEAPPRSWRFPFLDRLRGRLPADAEPSAAAPLDGALQSQFSIAPIVIGAVVPPLVVGLATLLMQLPQREAVRHDPIPAARLDFVGSGARMLAAADVALPPAVFQPPVVVARHEIQAEAPTESEVQVLVEADPPPLPPVMAAETPAADPAQVAKSKDPAIEPADEAFSVVGSRLMDVATASEEIADWAFADSPDAKQVMLPDPVPVAEAAPLPPEVLEPQLPPGPAVAAVDEAPLQAEVAAAPVLPVYEVVPSDIELPKRPRPTEAVRVAAPSEMPETADPAKGGPRTAQERKALAKAKAKAKATATAAARKPAQVPANAQALAAKPPAAKAPAPNPAAADEAEAPPFTILGFGAPQPQKSEPQDSNDNPALGFGSDKPPGFETLMNLGGGFYFGQQP